MVLQSPVNLQVLVSAVGQNVTELAAKMKIKTDAVIVNQCDRYDYCEFNIEESDRGAGRAAGNAAEKSGQCARVQCFLMKERGVGLSRNTALLHAKGEICLFSDEDIVLSEDYAQKIAEAYEQHPQADMLLFNVKVARNRRTYWNERVKRIHWYNYGRYPAYSISAKLDALRRANVQFSLLFGGGAKYSNGEDSLFLRDCLRAGLRIYALPVCIGEEVERKSEKKSTWFDGYTEKFFKDRGVLYHFLYGGGARLFALRFLLKNRKEMCVKIPFRKAYQLMAEGIRSQRSS